MAAYLEDNKVQIEMLRGWCIDYHPERKYWNCRHRNSQDSLLTCISVYVDGRNNVLSCDVDTLQEDSVNATQTALQNINTLYNIKCIYGQKYIDADEVYSNISEAEYVINLGDDTTLCQILLARNRMDTKYKHLYEKWYVKKHIAPDARVDAYLEENEGQLVMLRGWNIVYVEERDCWWCRHWKERDSLLSFVLVRVDRHDKIISCEASQLSEDSTIAIQLALQNISALNDIKRFYGTNHIGAFEVELFNDTLEYDYIIRTGKDTITYQIMLMKNSNDTIDKHLYKNWYLRKK